MNSFLKALPCATLLLCAAAHWQPLAAQIVEPVFAPVGPPPTASETRLPAPAEIQTAAPNRVYVGTLTRTGPTGTVTTGDVLMSVTPEGQVQANLTYNGHVHPYYGVVAPDASATKDSVKGTKHRVGTLGVTRIVTHPTTPGVVEYFTENLALTITASTAYGGTTSGKGTVVFTARRFGGVFSTDLPVGGTVIVGSGKPIGTVIGTTLPGG